MSNELIERLDAAPGPDRILDRDIEIYRGHSIKHPYTKLADRYVLSIYTHPDYGAGQGYLPAQFTASVDAALSLVPDGWSSEIGIYNHHSVVRLDAGGSRHAYAKAVTAPLAICIAALRAQEKDDD